ncbi:MAG: hypothetical protein KC618_01130 [Candidatus Omnitrophica bacterium]|nr:hypothetical protein [Candidatus Omnitrophota bacterium]
MIKKQSTTFDKWMKDAKIKKAYQEGYAEFMLSELIQALMENDSKSVRGLAKKVGLSPTVIQDIRSGKQRDMKIKNFLNIVHACGFEIVLEKGKQRIPLHIT